MTPHHTPAQLRREFPRAIHQEKHGVNLIFIAMLAIAFWLLIAGACLEVYKAWK